VVAVRDRGLAVLMLDIMTAATSALSYQFIAV
jgi:hypothetical protein